MLLRDTLLRAIVGTRRPESSDQYQSKLGPLATQTQRVFNGATSLPPRNLTIGRDPQFIWYRVAKVGTRSIVTALHEHSVDFIADHPYGVRVPPRLTNGFFRFAFVRDPRTRLVSAWRDKIVEWDKPRAAGARPLGLSTEERASLREFGDFVQYVVQQDPATCDHHFRPQTRLIDVERIDFVGRFENFASDFRTVFEQLGIPAHVPHANRSSSMERDPYTPSLLAEVEEYYAADLETFSY